MTPQEERDLYRKVDRLQTEVYLLGAIVGTALSIIRQLGYPQVEEAIVSGLTDAAASIPAHNEAAWDRFVAYIREQGNAVKVAKAPATSRVKP